MCCAGGGKGRKEDKDRAAPLGMLRTLARPINALGREAKRKRAGPCPRGRGGGGGGPKMAWRWSGSKAKGRRPKKKRGKKRNSGAFGGASRGLGGRATGTFLKSPTFCFLRNRRQRSQSSSRCVEAAKFECVLFVARAQTTLPLPFYVGVHE